MGKLTSWLLKGPEEGVVITLDRCILLPLKIIYLGTRILLRITLGKKRRDRLYAKYKVHFNEYFSPSFYIFRFLLKAIGFFRVGSLQLIKISVPHYDYKFYSRISKQDYATRENLLIERFDTKEGDIVIDVGAHIGRYTLIASKRVGANGKVIAIEAHPGNYEMLNRNIKLNGLSNVIALNYAVYSKQTKLNLYLPGEESGYTIYNTVMSNRANTREDKSVEVNANTLDSLISSFFSQQQVNWIKIDVEGAEFEVLKGATNILSKSKDIALLIEVHNSYDANHYKQIIDFLKPYNFKIEFEKIHESGERHIIVQKSISSSNNTYL